MSTVTDSTSGAGPLRGAGGKPVGRIPTVIEEFEEDRKNRHLHDRIPRSARYFRTARSPLVALLMVIASVAFLSYVAYGRDEIGSAKQASLQLDRAERMSRSAIMARPPLSVAPRSPLACWASDRLLMRQADLYFDRTGKRARTVATLDAYAQGRDLTILLPEAAIEQAPAYSRTCGLEAASVLSSAARSDYADARFDQSLVWSSLFLVWAAIVLWCMRAMENLRRSAGRIVNTSIAIMAWLPLWLIPFMAAGAFPNLTREIWIFRIIFVGSIILNALYYVYVRGRMALEVWKATGLDAPPLSALLWAPELAGTTALLAAPLWASFHTQVTVEGRVIEYDAVSDVLLGAGFVYLLVAAVAVAIYMIVVTAAQTIGLDQAMKGLEVAPD